MPRSCARSGRPTGTSSAPARASSSARTIPSPGAAGRITSIDPGSGSWTCSTITTASADGGRAPPVGIATAAPGATSTSAAVPIATLPATVRYEGSDSEAPNVSAPRTA